MDIYACSWYKLVKYSTPNMVDIPVIPKFIYIFNAILIDLPAGFFMSPT